MNIFLRFRLLAAVAVPLTLLPALAEARYAYTVTASGQTVLKTSVTRPSNRRKPPEKKIVERERETLRNWQRRTDVKNIANAVFFYKKAHKYELPPGIPLDTPMEICATNARDCTGMVDFRGLLKSYLNPLPRDPQAPKGGDGTGYFIYRDWKEKIYVSAPSAEEGWRIVEQH